MRNEELQMKYDAVIFDLDGTLLDTLGDLHLSVKYALENNGFPARTVDEVRAFVGNGIFKLIKRAVPEGTDASDTERVFADFKEHYAVHSRDNTAPYPGITELIERLKSDGVRLGVVSNKAHFAVKEIMDFYFGGIFDVVFGEREGIPRKPAPDAVLEAAEMLGGKKILYVGDSEVDVETAINAGLDHVMVTWGFRSEDALRSAGESRFVSSADELYGVITED